MIRFLKNFLLAILLSVSLFSFAPSGAAAYDLFGTTCTGSAKDSPECAQAPCTGAGQNSPTCTQAQSQGGDKTNRLTGTGNVIKDATDLVALITGIAAVIVIIISAISMITSGGNTESVNSSRRRLLAAVVGLVIVALSWTIITFVTNNLAKT